MVSITIQPAEPPAKGTKLKTSGAALPSSWEGGQNRSFRGRLAKLLGEGQNLNNVVSPRPSAPSGKGTKSKRKEPERSSWRGTILKRKKKDRLLTAIG
jgi:hypothetical protein